MMSDNRLEKAVHNHSLDTGVSMTEQKFYVEDTCALLKKPSQVGIVECTFSDVSTHLPDPRRAFENGIERSKSISKKAFTSFINSGVPPRGTVLVSWPPLPGQYNAKSKLIPETELILIDRGVVVGDIVKRSSRDAMSGTITHCSTTVTLVQPQPWPEPNSRSAPTSSSRNVFGNFSSNLVDLLHDIPAEELIGPRDYEDGSFVIYNNWVGRIDGCFVETAVRLANGSVVVVEDCEELAWSSAAEYPEVGDFVTTRKAVFRRGRWIYGSYDANVDPSGYVAGIHVTAIIVDWLCQKQPTSPSGAFQEPPKELGRDILESGNVFVYDSTKIPVGTRAASDRVGLNVIIGDKVRFRDVAGAMEKYGRKHTTSSGLNSKLNIIPKTASLGYDINTFIVSRMRMIVTVLWQDLTTSQLSNTDVVPFLDLDDDDEVWPGELVLRRKPLLETDVCVYEREEVGVVTSVNARDRIAQVKCFLDSYMCFAGDDHSILLPGSRTALGLGQSQPTSCYDIRSVRGIARRLGDFVLIVPREHEDNYDPGARLSIYGVSDPNSIEWFGEVVELGLDGLLSVRLGAAAAVIDVKVPWECTHLVHSEDWDDSEEDELSNSSMSLTGDEAEEDVSNGHDTDPLGHDAAWITEDDETLSDEDDDEDEEMMDDYKEDHVIGEAVAPIGDGVQEGKPDAASILSELCRRPEGEARIDQSSKPREPITKFTYDSMFRSSKKPDAFAVLEGLPPEDHHFVSHESEVAGSRMRRIQKEHRTLLTSLPDGVYVRAWESRLDLLRILILGPIDTPYEYAPFVIDMYISPTFPTDPPQAFFHSWTDQTGPINPNLYEDGKVCLSLLGTWPGDRANETWSASKSTILQIIVSILGLVLVEEPYYNEAGYEARMGSVESQLPSALYSERTYFKSRDFIAQAMEHPVQGFESEIRLLYITNDGNSPMLLARAIGTAMMVIQCSERTRLHATSDVKQESMQSGAGSVRRVSPGALIPLRRRIEALLHNLAREDEELAEKFSRLLREFGAAADRTFDLEDFLH